MYSLAVLKFLPPDTHEKSCGLVFTLFVISDHKVKGVRHQLLSSVIAVILLFFCSSLHPILHFCFHYSSIRKLDVLQDVLWVVNFSQEGLFDVLCFFFRHGALVLLRAAPNNRWMWEADERRTVLARDQWNTQRDSICPPAFAELKRDDRTHNARILSKMLKFLSPSRKGNDS